MSDVVVLDIRSLFKHSRKSNLSKEDAKHESSTSRRSVSLSPNVLRYCITINFSIVVACEVKTIRVRPGYREDLLAIISAVRAPMSDFDAAMSRLCTVKITLCFGRQFYRLPTLILHLKFH